MKKKKIGIATVYTGYNYGSSLQACATKEILNRMGFDAVLLKLSGSLVAGRDIRIKKLITIALRSLIHSGGLKSLKNYQQSISKELSLESVKAFNDFTNHILSPMAVSYRNLKKLAQSDDYAAFVCGSDQVWNAAVFYVDPFYYLRFAPYEKRIAFAPSFGRSFVPGYNRKKIAKYISQVKFKSVREESGVAIVKELTGGTAEVIIDPTLVLSAEEWAQKLDLERKRTEKYLLAYFLDEPSEKAVHMIEELSVKKGWKVIGLPYAFDSLPWKTAVTSAGPREFVELIQNASFVCTDSFHGTAFSLNFNVPFYTFERNYGNAGKQSARIESLLSLVGQTERYEPETIDGYMDIAFDVVNRILSEERNKAKDYLNSTLLKEKKSDE